MAFINCLILKVDLQNKILNFKKLISKNQTGVDNRLIPNYKLNL